MTEWFAGRGQRAEANDSLRWGILGRRTAVYFQTLTDGRRVFYPMGSLGRLGYVLRSTDQELVLATRIRENRKASMFVAWIGSMVVSLSSIGKVVSEWSYEQCLLVAVGLWLLSWAQAHLAYRRLTRSMERIRLPNTTLAHWRNVGRMISPVLLTLQGVILIGLLGLGLYLFATGLHPIGLFLLVSLGVPLVAWIVSVHGWRNMRMEA